MSRVIITRKYFIDCLMRQIFLTTDILSLLRDNPELSSINSNIIRNQGYQRSLKNDKS